MIKTMQSAFLFVPHKAGTTRDDRRFINTHLSHRAAERRKRGKRQPQILVTPTPKPPGPKVKLPTRPLYDDEVKDSSSSDGEAIPTAEPPLSSAEDEIETDLSNGTLACAPDPANMLSSGSRDPFISTLVPMTAPVRALLHFNDDIFQPWGESIEKGFYKRAAFSNKFFKTGNQLLQDKTTAYAFLARLASMASTLTSNQNLAMAATGFKSQAYENLRQHMVVHGMRSDSLLYAQMFSLLAMEIAAHNLDAAGIHARTLQQLIQNSPMTDCVNVGEDLICSVLWHECLRGGFSLQRPAFEVDRLLDQASMRNTLASAKAELVARDLMPPRKTNGFKAAGMAHDITACIGELRFMSDLTHAFESAPDLVTEDVMRAFGHRTPLISSRLLKLYNDAQDYLIDGAYPGYESEFHTAAATCLAARFWYRVATSHESVDVPPAAGFQLYRIYGTHKPVLERLKEAHEAYQESGEQARKQQLWLWILYVGTLAERSNTTLDLELKPADGSYFSFHFVKMAKSMGLFDWSDVDEVLSTFLYSDAVGMRSRQYFEEGMMYEENG